MPRFPLGMVTLFVISILIYFGLGQRVLDRMRLSDKGALAVIAAIILGSFIDIPITSGRIDTSINVGGGLVPIGLTVYVLSKAGTSKEWIRALAATLLTAVGVWLIGTVLMSGTPGGRYDIIDSLYVAPLVGGLIAYLVGRSRRSAFISATIGVLLGLDIYHLGWLVATGTPGTVNIGGAGAFDAIILSGIVAVLLAEIIGETRERLQGGPASKGKPDELLEGLKSVEMTNALGSDNAIDDIEKEGGTGKNDKA